MGNDKEKGWDLKISPDMVQAPRSKPKVNEVVITGLRIPFWNLMVFMIKAVLAAIPAMIIASIIIFVITTIFSSFLAGIGHQILR